jgi:hypothetical protein
MMYEILLCIGVLGLAAQTVMGFLHGGHDGHEHGLHAGHEHGLHVGHGAHNGHGHVAPHLGHGAPTPAGHAPAHVSNHAQVDNGHVPGGNPAHAHGQHNGDPNNGGKASSLLAPLWSLLSPLGIFSLCLGAGGAGIIARAYVANPWLVGLIALAGGAFFYRMLVRPLWNLILGFASKPAQSLAGTVAGEAEAVTRFDARGQGVVRVVMDGQIVQLLAHLEADDREKGVAVAAGEKLVVTSVDGQKNICRVTRF